MPASVPPPPERFDPITGRWQFPGGPLPDPNRPEFDPDDQQVTLIGPVPRELAEADDSTLGPTAPSAAARLRWAFVTVLGAGCTAVFAAMGLYWWGPALLTAALALWAARHALGSVTQPARARGAGRR